MNKGIYKGKNGTWYIHTTYKGKSITVRGFLSKRDAIENYDYAIEKWKREHNIYSIENEFGQAVDEFLEYRSKKITHETYKKDKMYISYWTVLFAHQTLRNVFVVDRLKIVYKDLIDSKDVSEIKKYRLIVCFNEFASFCYMSNYINADVFSAVKVIFLPPKMNRRTTATKRYIPENDFKAVISEINKVNDNLFALAVSVLYSSGLRISELLGLLGKDVDVANKKIKVCRQLLSSGELTDRLKTTNSYRDVPLTAELCDAFAHLKLNDLVNKRIFDYSHTDFRRKLSQFTDYQPHEFRHTFCTNLAKKCSNIADVSYCAKVSGHTVSMFLNAYCRTLENELVDKFF